MARPVLFIHGGGGGAYEADAKLAEALARALGPAYDVRHPRMPNEEEPDYPTWKRIILREVDDMGPRAVLVGHSIGASVLIKVLADEFRTKVAGLFLISGPFWHDDEFWRWDEVALTGESAARVPRDLPIFIYHGDADEFIPVSHLDRYAELFPQAAVHRLPGRNHQLNDDLTEIAREIGRLG